MNTPTTSSFASEAADVRREIIQLMSTGRGVMHMLTLMGHDPSDNIIIDDPTAIDYARALAANMADTLRRSQLMITDTDLCHLLAAAADAMPEEVLEPDDPPMPHGFCLLAEPIVQPGVHFGGNDRPSIPISGISWTHLPEGHFITGAEGAGESVLLTLYVRSEHLDEALGYASRHHLYSMQMFTSVVWTIGTPTGTVYGKHLSEYDPAYVEGTSVREVVWTQRLAAALWSLCKTPRVVADREEILPRHNRRRDGRAGVVEPDRPVRVYDIRPRPRPTGDPGDQKRPVDWQHRWMVDFHWRKPRANQKVQKSTLILPYLKGPDDKPFKPGTAVKLVRGGDLAN